jgi:hypothetical protein
VPDSLIIVSLTMGPLHPGVRDAWLRWAKSPRDDEASRASELRLDDVNDQELPGATASPRSPQKSSRGRAVTLGIGFDAEVGQPDDVGDRTLLAEWRKVKDPPLADTDPKMKTALDGKIYQLPFILLIVARCSCTHVNSQ